MNWLSDRQQKMILYMLRNGNITKKQQDFYLSPFFYTQIQKLVKLGISTTEWKEGHIHYYLTTLGKNLAEILSIIFKEVEDDI